MKKKVQTLKSFTAKMAAKYKSITTDKGVLEWDGEEDAVVGTKVYVPGEGEGAERQPAPDGDYTDPETGTVFTVADGAVTKIVTREEEEQTDEELQAMRARVEELEAEVEGLEEVVEEALKFIRQVREDFDAYKKAPAGKSAHERFNNADGKDGKGKELKGYARLAKVLRPESE